MKTFTIALITNERSFVCPMFICSARHKSKLHRSRPIATHSKREHFASFALAYAHSRLASRRLARAWYLRTGQRCRTTHARHVREVREAGRARGCSVFCGNQRKRTTRPRAALPFPDSRGIVISPRFVLITLGLASAGNFQIENGENALSTLCVCSNFVGLLVTFAVEPSIDINVWTHKANVPDNWEIIAFHVIIFLFSTSQRVNKSSPKTKSRPQLLTYLYFVYFKYFIRLFNI